MAVSKAAAGGRPASDTDQSALARPTKAGWRVNEWSADTGLSRSYVYELIGAGGIKTVKIGSMRIIVTRPEQYLASQGGE